MHLEGGGNSIISKLRDTLDKTQVHVRSLKSLGISGETYGVILTPLILSRLPSEYSRNSKSKESDLDYLLEFMREELERRERADTFKVTAERPEKSESKSKRNNLPTASSLMAP